MEFEAGLLLDVLIADEVFKQTQQEAVPHYSTDIGSAMLALFELEKQGTIDGAFISKDYCELYKDRDVISSANGDTPLAICRAILKVTKADNATA